MSEFALGAYVCKHTGAFWEGVVVGHYGTKQTEDGVAVQLFGWEDGPVQIYPGAALQLCDPAKSRLGPPLPIFNLTDEELEQVQTLLQAEKPRMAVFGPPPPSTHLAGWQDISTAPKNTKVLAAYRNELGNWRIVTACYHTQLDWSDEYGDHEQEYAPEDWYEESDSSEVIYPCSKTPTLWMPLPHPEAAPVQLVAPVATVKTMRLGDGRADYYVSIKVGNREVTPHVFREEFKAAYHVALYNWLLNGTEKPDLMAFDEGDWPAQATETIADVEGEIARVVQSVNEWDDRTSPDDYPEHLLITSEELADLLRNFAGTLEGSDNG